MGGPVRLRVVFEDPFLLRGSQRRKGLQQCWLQLRPDLTTIADLAAYLQQTFGLSTSCPRGLLLHMDNFILPSFESTCILKDEDIIMVKKNGVVFKDVLKVSDSQNQLQVLQSRQTSALNNSNLASKESQGNIQADEYDLVLCGGNTAYMETLPIEKGNAQSKRKHSHKLQGSDGTLAAIDSEGDSQGDEDNVGLHGNITCNETSTRKMISKCKRKLTKKLKSSDTLVFKDTQGDSQDEVDVDLANGNAAHKETPSREMTNAKNERKKSSKFKFLGDGLAIKDSQGDSHRDQEDVDLHGNAAQKEAPSQIMKAKHKRKYSKKLEASNTAIMNSQGDLQEAEEGSGFPIGNIVRREAPSSKMANSNHKRKHSNKLQSSDTLAIKDSQGDEEDLDLPNVNVAHPETASSEKKRVKHKRKHSDNLQASEKQSKGNAIAPASENADGDARKLPSRSARRKKAKRIWHRTYGSKKKLREVQKLENDSQRETSVHANADQDTDVDNELLPAIVRPGHIRSESSDMCSVQTNGPALTEIEVPENHIQKEPSENGNVDENIRDVEVVPFIVRPGHIRFESSDTCRMEADGPVEYLKWNGTTSKKKGQKWGREKIFFKWNDSNSSIQLCNEESDNKSANLVKVLNGKSSVKEVEAIKESTAKQAGPVMELNENSVAKESDAVKQLIEFESLLPLTRLPVEGDVLVYRLVELSSLWCPEVSPFRVGKVSSYDSSSKKIILLPLPEYPLLLKEMSEEGPESGSLYNEDGSLEIDFSSLVDVRWFKPPVSEGTTDILPKENLQNAAPVDDQELASCSSNRIENVNELSKGWEEINQVLNDKKAQLQKENDLNKRNSNTSTSTSPWPYKALRRNALGPTLALLRSSNVDEGK